MILRVMSESKPLVMEVVIIEEVSHAPTLLLDHALELLEARDLGVKSELLGKELCMASALGDLARVEDEYQVRECRSVETRCDTMMFVRPRLSSMSPFRTLSSVSASTAERESSRTRISGSMPRALEMAIRCFCPPESVKPFSPTMVDQPSGKSANVTVDGRNGGDAPEAFLAHLRPAIADIRLDGIREQEGILRHEAKGGPQARKIVLVELSTADEDHALRRIDETGKEPEQS